MSRNTINVAPILLFLASPAESFRKIHMLFFLQYIIPHLTSYCLTVSRCKRDSSVFIVCILLCVTNI
jgi:hypothetical protein